MAVNKAAILRKLKAYHKNPDLVKEVSNTELADLVLVVMGAVEAIDEAIKQGRLDGYTPKPDKDYLSKASATAFLTKEVQKLITNVDRHLNEKGGALDKQVQQAIQRIRDGKDGIVSEAEIERAATIAASLIQLPNFDEMLTTAIQGNGALLRDALETIPRGEEQLKQDAVQNLVEDLNELREAISRVAAGSGGTIGKNQVYNFIRQAIADGTITSGGGGTWGSITGTLSDQTDLQTALDAKAADNAVVKLTGDQTVAGVKTFSSSPVVPAPTTDLQAATKKYVDDAVTAGGGYTDEAAQDAVGTILTDSSEIDFTYSDATPSITAAIVAGSIDETKLDTSVNASLDLADSASQPGHTHTASEITDFDTEVSNNTDVTANTAKRSYPSADETKLAGIEANADVTDAVNIGSSIHGATAKTTPVDADAVPFIDSAASNVLKKISWSNIKATLKTYFDTLYAASSHTHTAADVTDFDTEVSNNTDVAANTAARHSAVTVTDSAEINFTLTGQDITASLVAGSIDETKLDTSVNASLDLADSALQTSDVDDTPVNGATTAPVSSNWAYDHENAADPHTQYVLESAADEAISRSVSIQIQDGATDLATGDGKAYFMVPAELNGFILSAVRGGVVTAGTTGTTDFQIHNVTDAVDILSTKLTIDSGETTSATAATAAVINTANDDVATNDVLRIDVDAVSTTAPKGGFITLTFTKA